jgi:hypothetical protein
MAFIYQGEVIDIAGKVRRESGCWDKLMGQIHCMPERECSNCMHRHEDGTCMEILATLGCDWLTIDGGLTNKDHVPVPSDFVCGAYEEKDSSQDKEEK